MRHKKAAALLLAGTMAIVPVLGGCGSKIDSEAIVATCGDQELSLGYLNFFAHYSQASYDSWFMYMYGTDSDYWHSDMYGDGTTMEQSVKDSVLTAAEIDCLLAEHMDDYGVEITEEEEAEMRAAGDEFMAENTDEAIKAMGATSDYIAEFLWYDLMGERMEAAIEDQVGNDLDIADFARRTFSYIRIGISGYTDDDGEHADYTDEELDEIYAEAEAMAEEMQEDYDGTAEEYGCTVYTYSYGEDEESEESSGLFPEDLLKEADSMTDGEVSGVIEGEGYLYIIRLDSEDDEDAAEQAMENERSEIKSSYYSEVTDGYLEDSDFTVDEKLWEQVKFTDLFLVTYDEEEE